MSDNHALTHVDEALETLIMQIQALRPLIDPQADAALEAVLTCLHDARQEIDAARYLLDPEREEREIAEAMAQERANRAWYHGRVA